MTRTSTPDDSYRKVEVTALKLMNKGSEEVITEDASMVFASEVECVDHAPPRLTQTRCHRTSAPSAPWP